MTEQGQDAGTLLPWTGLGPVGDYWVDAFQRSVLFLDVLRQRGNTAKEHNARSAPNVLHYQFELLVDGRTLDRPVNYALVRILPPEGTRIDAAKRPFIVVDPRAGHGPGIGGMKHDSEIGVALAAGHPSYFIGFLPNPVPGQTIEDVCRAEAVFVRTVADRHPDAEGKPVLVGNCQAGWQLMMMAAVNPDLCGPIMLAGSPLSYWAGVRGKNPLRYLGGVLGGTWMTALAGDLGHGIFDGADLVRNFESMNPANTLWGKPYNVYSKVDTEAARFLEFETWWGSPVLLNAGEMQWIADNLFVGNKLTAGALHTSDGVRIDLRNIRSPIVVLCSWGDDITPPQQALGWITDLYDDDREIVANGQTIVYTLHHSIGHLGIFVSAKVATREHQEFATSMDLIDLAPPGLYEAVITDVGEDTEHPELIEGRYLFRLERRTLADIRALGNNDPEDQLRFATAARVSEANLALYRSSLAPLVRSMTTEKAAETMRALHPARLKFSLLSDENPAMQPVKTLADMIRANRKPVPADNPLLAIERMTSDWITTSLGAAAAARDAMEEQMFLFTYGSPWLQALMGFGPEAAQALKRADRDVLREANEARLRAELESHFESGGMAEAVIRALVYIRLPEQSIDERGYNVASAVRQAQPAGVRLSLPRLKAIFREQFLLLTMDPDRAVRALRGLLPADPAARQQAVADIRRVLAASGRTSGEATHRLGEIEAIFTQAPPAAEVYPMAATAVAPAAAKPDTVVAVNAKPTQAEPTTADELPIPSGPKSNVGRKAASNA
jgi:pimeloyl-ACP methyl ester carboxylesterase